MLIIGFNPRVREGRDPPCERNQRREHVSIHASVKDATLFPGVVLHCVKVSIHASVKDATGNVVETTYATTFQSTRP